MFHSFQIATSFSFKMCLSGSTEYMHLAHLALRDWLNNHVVYVSSFIEKFPDLFNFAWFVPWPHRTPLNGWKLRGNALCHTR